MTQKGRPKFDDILTPAEWQVTNAIRHGMTSRQIANKRGITIDAVKYHVKNILSKLHLKNRKELRHWAGSAKEAAIQKSNTPLQKEKSMTNTGTSSAITLDQISRQVSDIDASTSWYRDTLGLTLLYSFEGMAFFDLHSTRLYLQQAEGDLPTESTLYFKVDDVRTTYEKLISEGVGSVSAPHMVHKHENGIEEWMAFINDPDGRPIGLMSQHG